ncbi:MAG: DUF4446 family protein [Solirubrobacteraceae bacterium]
MNDLTSTPGLVALAATVLALAALVAVAVVARRLRRMRADQQAILGGHAPGDLVEHAAGLERGFQALNDYVQDVSQRLDARLTEAELRVDGAIAYRSLVRYDAYNEMSGRQSTSLALLDARGSGVVLSSIHHRDQARLYAKQVVEGVGRLELSPEEQEAVRVALAGEVPAADDAGR